MRSPLLILLTLLSLVSAISAGAVASKTPSQTSEECIVNLADVTNFHQLLPGVSPSIPPRKTIGQFKTKEMMRNRDYENENKWRYWSNRLPSKVRYLNTESEREKYRIFAYRGLLYHSDGRLLDTEHSVTYLFIMDEFGNFYAGEGRDYFFHHSSFLAGKAVAAAGLLEVTKGELKVLKHWTGHYQTTDRMFTQAAAELFNDGINLRDVAFIPFSPKRGDNPPAIKFYELALLPDGVKK